MAGPRDSAPELTGVRQVGQKMGSTLSARTGVTLARHPRHGGTDPRLKGSVCVKRLFPQTLGPGCPRRRRQRLAFALIEQCRWMIKAEEAVFGFIIIEPNSEKFRIDLYPPDEPISKSAFGEMPVEGRHDR